MPPGGTASRGVQPKGIALLIFKVCGFVNKITDGRRVHSLLAAYCEKNGIDFEELRAGRMMGTRKYERVVFNNFTGATPDALRIKTFGRFGNSCVRIWNALIVAKALGIKTVVIPDHAIWKPTHLGSALDLNVIRNADFGGAKGRSVLEGDLLTTKPFKKALSKLSNVDRQLIVQNYLQPCVLAYVPAAEAIPEEDIVLHFRSGDVFSRLWSVHPNYLQPPFAYYQICLQHHLGRYPNANVHLVYEDRGNPCIAAVEKYLKQLGVSWKSHSADLKTDLSFLMEAATVVWGIGSFGRGISLCSTKLRRSYNFHNQPFDVSAPSKKPTYAFKLETSWAVYDEGGGYIRPGTWKNRPAQHVTMLEYPMNALLLKENRPVVRAARK